MTRSVPQPAIEIIKQFEGFRSTAYLCPAGIPTIGYGHTKTVKPSDVGVKRITTRTAEYLLRDDLQVAVDRLYAVLPANAIIALNDNQWSALIAFAYNVGAKASWTIWRLVKDRAYARVPAEMGRFVNADGRRIQGLVNRRRAEGDLWQTPEGGFTPDIVEAPSKLTPVEPTPIAPVPATPDAPVIAPAPTIEPTSPMKGPAQSRTFLGGIVAAVTGGLAAIGSAINQLMPFAASNHLVANVVVGLTLVAALGGLAVAFFRWQDIQGSHA